VTSRILFVDDEFNVLAAIRRQLHKRFEIEIARGGEDALSRLQAADRFAVVVSDLRMPGIDGLGLLCQARKLAPRVVRIVLSGQADPRSMLTAVNDCGIFRYLTKPCDTETLGTALDAALEQHRVEAEERLGVEQTLSGSVALVTEILELVNPVAAERATRIKRYVRHMTRALHLDDPLVFDLAAGLSQVGCVSVSPQALDRMQSGGPLTAAEQGALDRHSETGGRLLAHIPGLARVAAMIAAQAPSASGSGPAHDAVGVGTRLLRVATAFDGLVMSGTPIRDAVARLGLDPVAYPPAMVEAIATFHVDRPGEGWLVRAKDLKPGMIFVEDVRARDNVLLASRTQEATPAVVARILEAAAGVGVPEPFRVRVPAAR
jgi:response regulator RpfG family c-di-GMP phosphodiesterase